MEQEAANIQAARYAILSEIVLLIAKTPDLQQLLKQLINKVKWVLDFDRCTLALLNDDGQAYQLQTLLEPRRAGSAFWKRLCLFPRVSLGSHPHPAGVPAF